MQNVDRSYVPYWLGVYRTWPRYRRVICSSKVLAMSDTLLIILAQEIRADLAQIHDLFHANLAIAYQPRIDAGIVPI